ncbi:MULTISPECIES: hypothetical protein [Cyanophyceae]|uniref:Uncharacterized protein n=1 Tax=Plectonema cf. radiosum LEGE 06105 TaxID=945769 RepID=A0A8J7EWF6_9CYAN|nr:MULTISPECIES: hypothetical protein [Cyanophyceae]MBE9211341.1 hypothetical protein [Plectonema cf. radiosum LEGE 06105]MEA5570413.1 hypothetical protein [Calothrix sp. UHCC 0171]
MNFQSNKPVALLMLGVLFSGLQVIIFATPSRANPYLDEVRKLEREYDNIQKIGDYHNQRIVSNLSCGELRNRWQLNRNNYLRWMNTANNSPTQFNRRASLASAQGSLNAMNRHANEFSRRCR